MTALPVFEGPYALEEERCRGPIVDIYRAVSSTHGTVLLRLLKPRLAAEPSLNEQFRSRVGILSDLNHPNLGVILDAGTSRGIPYYVGPDLPGILHDRIGRGPLPLQDTVRIGIEVAEALAHLHAHDLVHRDVRPGTIWFDEQERAVLCEFGLEADPDRSARTMVGTFLGSLAYMAPEQIAGVSRFASDAYSLGIVLFEMVAGRPPFQDPDPVKLSNLQTYQPAPPLDRIVPGTPEGLVRLAACLLEKEPNRRVARMHEVVEALRSIGPGTPPPSGPTPPPAPGDRIETVLTSPPPKVPSPASAGSSALPPIPPGLPPLAPPPAPPSPPRLSRDPTWLRPESGGETRFFSPGELRRIGKSAGRSVVPFWVWLIGAILVTIVATLLILHPWDRPEPADESSGPPVGTGEVESPPSADLFPEDAPHPEPLEPPPERSPAATGASTEPTQPSTPARQTSPPPPKYDWTAKPATLLISAATEEMQPVAASIHLDGRALGEQTTKEITVGPGIRKVRVVRSGMEPIRAHLDGREIEMHDGEVAVTLEPGKTVRLRFVLRRS